jgi:hypothetical protein
MPNFIYQFFPQAAPRVIRIIGGLAYAWARPILVEVGLELLEQGDTFVVGWLAR